ncbi:FAD-dependent oxidoreductase [Caulobacter sp. S45]|uniref:FAD-dependent oxidoreductase n=1 Tax=Caulobacter sp. S45 TaxID=1641861 RepID=UPI00131C6FAE|nr:FAD-dependent oxidoreductase [Caulobacter sp. S45]
MSSRETTSLDRRRLLRGSALFGGLGLLGLGGCATASGASGPAARQANAGPSHFDPVPPLAPLRAHTDRLFDLTVCLRPFRAAGPRLDTEQIGDTLVVHNYGHGGSGWSLSWGSGTIAVRKAMANSPREVAVIGCGALGLTSAILAQRAGAKVTIYAKDLLPQTRSSRATGAWTPDSRIALTQAAGPAFGELWEQMARTSFKTYRSYLGLPGTPVEWVDQYSIFDLSQEQRDAIGDRPDPLGFASYRSRIRDLTPREELLPAGSTPFQDPYVYRSEMMIFNIADYGHTLMADFLAAGGQIRQREFHAPSDLTQLPEKVVINCPGYGGRALWKDETITPVRGQIGWLIPQPELNYGLYYNGVSVVPRRDGIVVQAVHGGDMKGYGDLNETTDRAESEQAVSVLADLYSRFRAPHQV